MTRMGVKYGLYAIAVVVGVTAVVALAPHRRVRFGLTATIAKGAGSDLSTVSWSERSVTGRASQQEGAAHALALARQALPPSDAKTDDGDMKESVPRGEAGPPHDALRGRPARSERLNPSRVMDLADRCAPTAPSSVLASIVHVESGGDPLKIGVNGAAHRVYAPASKAAAVALARQLIGQGDSVDLGLAQINSRNLPGLGLSIEEAFDGCRNLAAAATMINRGYAMALKVGEPNRPILQTAYSIYNSGDSRRGFDNGYAAKVDAAVRSPSDVRQR
jgi:type IV secretion system protein VirB1